MNTFGRLLRLTTWGESHGEAIGGVLDGFPSDFEVDVDAVQEALARRAPGQSPQTTARREADSVEFLSGLFEGRTTGAPIAFVIRNSNQHSRDYDALRPIYRPGHADWTYQVKYRHRDHRGGGRASARETAMRVVAGALATQWLQQCFGIKIYAYADQVGQAGRAEGVGRYPYAMEAVIARQATLLRCPDPKLEERMIAEIDAAKAEGDSVGGVITCIVTGMPLSLGEPIYDKLEARLASAMLSINACRAFEIGEGFGTAHLRGSESNDEMYRDEAGCVCFYSNNSGGALGGISTGQDLRMRVAFKPTPSIARSQRTLPVAEQEIGSQSIEIVGRHDPCVIPRAIPVVEAMCALVLMDMLLLSRRG